MVAQRQKVLKAEVLSASAKSQSSTCQNEARGTWQASLRRA